MAKVTVSEIMKSILPGHQQTFATRYAELAELFGVSRGEYIGEEIRFSNGTLSLQTLVSTIFNCWLNNERRRGSTVWVSQVWLKLQHFDTAKFGTCDTTALSNRLNDILCLESVLEGLLNTVVIRDVLNDSGGSESTDEPGIISGACNGTVRVAAVVEVFLSEGFIQYNWQTYARLLDPEAAEYIDVEVSFNRGTDVLRELMTGVLERWCYREQAENSIESLCAMLHKAMKNSLRDKLMSNFGATAILQPSLNAVRPDFQESLIQQQETTVDIKARLEHQTVTQPEINSSKSLTPNWKDQSTEDPDKIPAKFFAPMPLDEPALQVHKFQWADPPENELMAQSGQPLVKNDVPQEPQITHSSYKLKAFLGVGGYGIVFSGHTDVGPLVAIKLLPLSNEDSGDDLLRECKIMASPENWHPNLVKLLRQTTADSQQLNDEITNLLENSTAGSPILDNPSFHYHRFKIQKPNAIIPCIEMELCVNTLRTWLMESTRTDDTKFVLYQKYNTAARIASDVITGLKFLHSKGILHRDLKPENIYFSAASSDGRFNPPIKIGDFGQSRAVDTSHTVTQTNKVFSDLYRAKEARIPAEGSDGLRYGKNADWFTVGLILYEIFYSIPHAHLPSAFDEIVNDRELRQSQFSDGEHAVGFSRVEDIILGLTYRRSEQRRKTIDFMLSLDNVQEYLCSESLTFEEEHSSD